MPPTKCAEVESPGKVRFNLDYCLPATPVVIRGGARGWIEIPELELPALVERLGDKPVRVAHNARGVFDPNDETPTGRIEQQKTTFREATRLVTSDEGYRYYMAQKDLRRSFPELERFIGRAPLLDPTKLVIARNLWIGGAGCKSSLHFDQGDNFLAQVTGSKRIRLFSPRLTTQLYPAVGRPHPHCSLVNAFDPDDEAFPLYRSALDESFEVELYPGDVLYIPTLWWHAVYTMKTSVSINVWWMGPLTLVQRGFGMLTDETGRAALRTHFKRPSS